MLAFSVPLTILMQLIATKRTATRYNMGWLRNRPGIWYYIQIRGLGKTNHAMPICAEGNLLSPTCKSIFLF